MEAHTSHTAFVLVLDTLHKGKTAVLPEARCTFSYHWDINTNTGQAQLVGINGSMLAITMFPEGLKGTLSFSTDMQPTQYTIKGVQVVINKVFLQINLEKNTKEAAIAFGYDGTVIQTTKNFKYETK